MRSHLPVSPMAISSPRTSARARMSKRHSNGDSGIPYDPAIGPGNARTVAWRSNAAGSRARGFPADRNAKAAFAQRNRVETAKTTTKRAAFVANTVQKTPTYPIDENHAQSTTMLLMRASAKRKTMTATSTPMRLKRMLRVARSRSGTDSRRRLGKRRELAPSESRRQTEASFGLAFPGDRRTDDNFRLLSLLGQASPRRGDASLRRLARIMHGRLANVA